MENNSNDFLIELQNMEYRLDEMQEKLDQLDFKLTQVVEALLGNSLTKVGGIVSEMESLKKRLSDLELRQQRNDDFRKKASWTFAFVIGLIIFIQYITNIYSNIKR